MTGGAASSIILIQLISRPSKATTRLVLVFVKWDCSIRTIRRTLHVPMNCTLCGTALVYIGTLTIESRDPPTEPTEFVDVHVYRCLDHGMFRLANEGLTPEIEHLR